MNDSFIYGKNAIIEALESGNREFNRILISNTSRSDEKIEKIKYILYLNEEEYKCNEYILNEMKRNK